MSNVVTADVTARDRAVAENLLRLRIAARLTPRQLSAAAGLNIDVVNHVENVLRPATPAEIAALAGALGVTVEALAGGAR